MTHATGNEFIDICKEILAENKTEEEWAEIESDDQFQTDHYIGGFDATEMEFCFAVWIDGAEYWFQLPLADIEKVVTGIITEVEIRNADK